jgi:mandelate racemase
MALDDEIQSTFTTPEAIIRHDRSGVPARLHRVPAPFHRTEHRTMNAPPLPRLTFEGIRARPVLVPMKRPIVNRVISVERWPVLLIDLYTREGVVGRSYLQPYLARTMPYLIAALDDLAQLLKGRPVAPVDLFRDARKSLLPVGHQGQALIAVSGLDMAAWDALARASGLPLCTFLGGSIGAVRAYSSNGLWFGDPHGKGDEALELLAEGDFTAVKLRLGRERAADDLCAVHAVKQAVGEEVKVMVDYSQAMHMGEALQRCHQIDDLGLEWIEEPIVTDDLDGYARLCSELKTPVQTGENFYGVRDLYHAAQARACDVVMVDLMRIGGVTGWLRCAPIAAAAGLPLSNHLYPEMSAHLLRVSESAHWLEWLDWALPVLARPFEVDNGELLIPDEPGTGIEWDEDFVAAHLVD